jgi:hypothetical protein
MKKAKALRYPLKAWDDPAWKRRLSKTLTVSRVDENIPTDEQKPIRKPWFLAITRTSKDSRTVRGLPAGRSVLLSEDEVLGVLRYLFEPQLAVWAEKPTPTEPGTVLALMFLQPGMVAIAKTGQLWIGEGQWTPKYFKRQKPIYIRRKGTTNDRHSLSLGMWLSTRLRPVAPTCLGPPRSLPNTFQFSPSFATCST